MSGPGLKRAPALPGAFLRHPIAHRALHGPGAPENSRAAVAAAVDAGYGIEIDLQMSADGAPMVFHDGGLARLTGEHGPVRERSAEALGAIALTGGNEGIPTFREVLALVGGRVPLLVEIKDQSGDLGAIDGRLERAAVAAVEGYEGPLAFMSYNPRSVAVVGEVAPHWPRGVVSEDFIPAEWPGIPAERLASLGAMADVDAVGASFVSREWVDLEIARVAELAQAGLNILCWTVRSPEDEAVARRVADNITFEHYRPAMVS